MKFRPLNRRAAGFGALVFGVIALGGCTYLNPIQTHHFYQSAEGSVVNFEPEGPSVPVGMRNFLVVEHGGAKYLTGTISNQSRTDYTVDIAFTSGATGSVSINVPAGKTVKIGGDEQPALEVLGDAKAGDNVFVDITVNGETKPLTIQVLDSSLEYLEPGDTAA